MSRDRTGSHQNDFRLRGGDLGYISPSFRDLPLAETELPFGKYRLIDRIAAGGMAEIFKARYSPAAGVTRQVVIKKILPHYAENKAFIAMFTNEARIAMGLSHGNIAQVFDFGSIDGDYFLAMELVDGQPLSKILKRMKAMGIEAMPVHFAAYIAIEMLKGLHYAHSRLDEQGRPLQIVHRDVSPQNVLVSYESQVKLVDFGIARARNASEDTSTSVKGKYVYFAPEQAKGKDLDARTDIFAAGIILYEMLTGQLPFQGKMMEALSRIVKGNFPPPREVNPLIPEELSRIVLKAMALDRNARYATAEEFHQDLGRHLARAHANFTPADLNLFLHYLFEPDLVASGRPVQLPPTFTNLVRGWQQTVKKDDDNDAPTEMTSLDHLDEPQARPLFIASPHFSGDARRKQPSSGRLALVAAAAIAVGFIGVFTLIHARKATLEVNSTPAGATVVLDGKTLNGKTPLNIAQLDGERRYQLELTLPGRQPWKNDVPLKRGQHLVVNATLDPEAAAPLAIDPPTPTPITPDPVAAVADQVTWPVKNITLDVSRHHLELNAAGATVVKLEPAATYRVSLSPGQSIGWGFYVVNDAGASPVAFANQPLQIKGASKLFVFHFPLGDVGGRSREETKPRVLSVTSLSHRKTLTHSISPRLDVNPSTHVLLKGLDRGSVYEITPHQSTSAPAKLRSTGLPLSLLVMGTESGLAVIPFNVPTRVTATERALFTVVDDNAADPAGEISLEIKEMPIIGKHR